MLTINGSKLTIEEVYKVSNSNQTKVEISEEAKREMQKSRDLVETWVKENKVIYGVTTGFGEFANVSISNENLSELQVNLIRSHSAGAGEAIPKNIMRAMMLLRINALAKGFSGIRVSTVQTLIDMLNKDIIPFAPMQGSVGSSGDLVQLSHLVLAAIGEGKVWSGNEFVGSKTELEKNGIKPVELTAKEGLALINGTQMMSSFGSIATCLAEQYAKTADIIAALSVDALKGTDNAYDPRLHSLRPHAGQMRVARNLKKLIHGSEIRESHRTNDDRVQDAYSLRCIPQIHGASRDAIDYVKNVLSIEINAVTDNPVIFPEEGNHIEGGNFHGQPVALALDFLAIAVAELANVSERRTERMVNGALSRLPRFLTPFGGLHSGYMIAQYTAASIVSENKVLCHPASVDSIPTSANQEDHNSMGSIAAQKSLKVVNNLARVLAVEYICAVQGIDFHKPLKTSNKLNYAYELLRNKLPTLENDRIIYDDICIAEEIIKSGELNKLIELE